MLSHQSSAAALGEAFAEGTPDPSIVLGWAGFQDLRFIQSSFGVLLLATALGAVIGYHPATRRTARDLQQAEMPHVYVLYAVIGAVIGVAVHEFGMGVGVVVFGLGGLLRFRSLPDSVHDTVRLIIVTLAGLIAGLDLPAFAVITTVFSFALIYCLDSSPPYRIRIEGVAKDRAADSADAYREMLTAQRCKIIAEHKSFEKGRIEFVFRLPWRGTRAGVEAAQRNIAPDLRGDVDWEVG